MKTTSVSYVYDDSFFGTEDRPWEEWVRFCDAGDGLIDVTCGNNRTQTTSTIPTDLIVDFVRQITNNL